MPRTHDLSLTAIKENLLAFEVEIKQFWLQFGRQGCVLGNNARIWALRLEYGLKRNWASGLQFGLAARIWASMHAGI